MSNRMTRREFLRYSALSVATAALSACAQQVTPTSAPSPSATSAPSTQPTATSVPKPTATIAAPATIAPVTLRMWSWFNAPTDPLWDNLLKEFQEKNPTIKVALDVIPLNDMRQKVITANQAGDPPDLSRIHPSWLGEFWEADFLEPLDDYLAAWQYKSELSPSTLDLGRPRAGKPLLMLPVIGLMVYVMYYRQDWLKETGLPIPTTWDGWLDVAKKMTIPDKRWGFSMRGGRQGWSHGWVHLLKSNGIEIVDAEGKIDINSEKAIELNQWWIDLYRKHKVTPPSAITDDYPQIAAHWQAGNVGMFFHGAHAAVDLTKTAGDNVQAAPPPKGQVKGWTRADYVGWGIWKKSKNKEAAWKLLSWLLEPEQHRRLVQNPLERFVPALISIGKEDFVKKDRFTKAAVDSLEMWGVLPYWHPYWSTLAEKDWHATFQKALLGEITSKQMMDGFALGFQKAGMPKR